MLGAAGRVLDFGQVQNDLRRGLVTVLDLCLVVACASSFVDVLPFPKLQVSFGTL